jgi:hypothetical protein
MGIVAQIAVKNKGFTAKAQSAQSTFSNRLRYNLSDRHRTTIPQKPSGANLQTNRHQRLKGYISVNRHSIGKIPMFTS